MKKYLVFFWICGLAWCSLSWGARIDAIGRWPYRPVKALAAGNDRLFMAVGDLIQTMHSDTLRREATLRLDAPEGITGIFFSDNKLFVSAGSRGIRIINADPSDDRDDANGVYLSEIGSFTDFTQDVSDLFVSGDHVYAVQTNLSMVGTGGGDFNGRLDIIDVSNPSSPVRAGDCMFTAALGLLTKISGIVVVDEFAFVVDSLLGLLYIVDVSSVETPEIKANIAIPGIHEIVVNGNYAYADGFTGEGEYGIVVIDISDKSSPRKTASVGFQGEPRGVFIDGNALYMADWRQGLRIINISDPENPISAGTFGEGMIRSLSGSYDVIVSGGGIYVADYGTGLHRFQISDSPFDLSVTAVMAETPANADDLHMSTDGLVAFTVASGENEGLRAFDVTSIFHLRLRGFLATPGQAQAVTARNDFMWNLAREPNVGELVRREYVYIADGSEGLRIVRVEARRSDDEKHPFTVDLQETGAVATPDHAQDVFLSGDGGKVFVAAKTSGLIVVDVLDPAAPRIIGTCDTTNAKGVFVQNDHAYVADGIDGFRIIDASRPFSVSDGSLIRTIDTSDATAVFISQTDAYTIAYIADGTGGLKIVDVMTPTSAFRIGGMETEGVAKGVFAFGAGLALAVGESGIRVINVLDPSEPEDLQQFSYDTPGNAKNVYVATNMYMFVSDGPGGLLILKGIEGEDTDDGNDTDGNDNDDPDDGNESPVSSARTSNLCFISAAGGSSGGILRHLPVSACAAFFSLALGVLMNSRRSAGP